MSEARTAVIDARYKLPHEQSENDVWDRVARAWADDEAQWEQFYDMMRERRALPNTPAIANAGKAKQCGSACFVLPIEDSLDGIMQTLKDATIVHQFGGGTGFSFGRIRPQGYKVSSTGRDAPGPVSFLDAYSGVFKHVSQAGLRNAANMGILPVEHPDIMDFIMCKSNEGKISNFNISVALSDEFMKLVVGGYSDKYESGYRTPDIWTEIVEGAWRNGEPGAFFIDTVNRTSLHPESIEATNPCGEVPLLPYEACVLGSVNLGAHLMDVTDTSARIDWTALDRTVRQLVNMLDNIVEKQDYPLEKIREAHHRYRKIGVGVMGYADMLTLMGYEYGSAGAITLAENVMRFIQQISYDESRKIGLARGVYNGWNADLPARRNLCCQVIAPTGSIARLAGCSFGIEPHFMPEYDSFIVGGSYREVNPLKDHPAFMVAADVSPVAHIRTQAAFQKFTDQAVSKTVNLPKTATHEDVAGIYKLAWELGCKGVTVYREGSREEAVIVAPGDCKDGVCAL